MKKAVAASVVTILLLAACTKSKPVASQSPPPSPTATQSSASASLAPSVSPTPSASPSPEKLPLSEARVEGKFLGSGTGTDYTFVPKCKKGACSVWGTTKKSKTNFSLKGGLYSGGGTIHDDCSAGGLSTDLTVKVKVSFRAKKAEWIDGEWRATVLSVKSSVDSPGAKKSVTSGGMIRTVTCDPYHKDFNGSSFLKGH